MSSHLPPAPRSAVPLLAAALLLAAAPRTARAEPGAPAPAPAPTLESAPRLTPDLSFDLIGEVGRIPPVDDAALRSRRTYLNVHQGVGLGMFALTLGTTVVGQLNYDAKYGPDHSRRWVGTHGALAAGSLVTFAAAATLAILAPKPVERRQVDRVWLHKVCMAVAAAGMATQATLGVLADEAEGRGGQRRLANTHLAIGYLTFAAVAAGAGALIF